MFSNTFSRFRVISFIEGLSYLILVFIAMPLKYLAGIPLAVKLVGMTHGVLFIIFMLALFLAKYRYKWNTGITFQLFVYSLIPFGYLMIEKVLKRLPKDKRE